MVLCKGVWEMSLVWWPQAQVNLSYCGKKEPRGTEPNTGRHGLHFLSLLHSQTNVSFPLCPVLAF